MCDIYIYIYVYIYNQQRNKHPTSNKMIHDATDTNRYSSKDIHIHPKGERILKSFNNKTHLINIQQ